MLPDPRSRSPTSSSMVFKGTEVTECARVPFCERARAVARGADEESGECAWRMRGVRGECGE
eukprot:664638-Rhodomonas_salina.1